MRARLLEIIESPTLLQVESGQSQLAEVEQRDSQGHMGLEEEGGRICCWARGETLLSYLACRLERPRCR